MNFFKTADLSAYVEAGVKDVWDVLSAHENMERQFRRTIIVLIKTEPFLDRSKMSDEEWTAIQTFIASAKEGLGLKP